MLVRTDQVRALAVFRLRRLAVHPHLGQVAPGAGANHQELEFPAQALEQEPFADGDVADRLPNAERRLPIGLQAEPGERARRAEAARVEQAPGERLGSRQVEHRVAEQARHPVARLHEIGGLRGVEDILVGPVQPLVIVALQKLGGAAVENQGEFPRQVVGVLDSAVAPARAEGGDDMRAVPQEDDAVMDEPVHSVAAERVDRYPVEFEGPALHGPLQPRGHILRFAHLSGIRVRAELQVDAVNVVRLLVQQRRLAVVEGRIEPEPALVGEVRLHHDVGDEELLLEAPPLE